MIDLEQILQQVESEVVRRLLQLDFDELYKLPVDEIVQLAAQIELLGYDRLLNEIESDGRKTLQGLVELAQTKKIVIDAGKIENYQKLIDLNTFQARKASEYHLSQILSATIFGNIAGENTNEIIKRIPSDIPFSKSQLVAEIDQNVTRYNSVVTAGIFDDEDQRFILEGPDDLRTRCSCRGVLEFQPKEGHTLLEIKKGAWTKYAVMGCEKYGKTISQKVFKGEYTWLDRGEYNCRHYGQPL